MTVFEINGTTGLVYLNSHQSVVNEGRENYYVFQMKCYNIVCGGAMKDGKRRRRRNDDGGGGLSVGVWKPNQIEPSDEYFKLILRIHSVHCVNCLSGSLTLVSSLCVCEDVFNYYSFFFLQ